MYDKQTMYICRRRRQVELMSEGIIISVDYGFGMKYGDEDEPYLMLEIKQTNNWQCFQYFHNDNIRKVLEHFNEKKINKLLYKTVELGEMPNSTLNPNRIRYTLADDWLYNDNKRQTIKINWKEGVNDTYE